MYTPSTHYMNFHIAGFTYWDGLDVIDKLKLGAEVRLESEPDNPYDPDAVAVYLDDCKLGYIPQHSNDEISKFLYFGYGDIFTVRISEIDPEAHPEQQYRVTVKIKDNR